MGDAFRLGMSVEEVFNISKIDPWFLVQIADLVRQEQSLAGGTLESLGAEELRALKRSGFADARLAKLLGTDTDAMRAYRHALGVRPVFKRVDTCAAEFATNTAYMYSTYEEECESLPTGKRKIMVLGGGPNRIGQGIEFDYCCVHAALAMREDGYETIMVNCNPETVSTDYDTSDRLYFEPLTLEDVLEVVAVEKPVGVIVQFGGQTPLSLAHGLEKNGVPIIGTSPDMIDCAEDRARFQQMLHQLRLKQPPNRTACNTEEGIAGVAEIGYPLVMRPSNVLGGRAMEIIHEQADLERYMRDAQEMSKTYPERMPILLDRFLDDAIEVDVDAVSDGKDVVIGGIMEHIEQAGVHSGDSACSLPPFSLSAGFAGRTAPPDCGDGKCAERGRADECAVRDPDRQERGRRGICAGSESARVAHRAVRVQGDRSAAGENRGALHGRAEPGTARASPRKWSHRFTRSRKRYFRSSSFPAWTRYSGRK